MTNGNAGPELVLLGDVAGSDTTSDLPARWERAVLFANFEGVVPDIAQRHGPGRKLGPRLQTDIPLGRHRWAWTLANNHSPDFGSDALLETRNVLATRGMPSVGAGENRDSARQPLYIELSDSLRIGIVACCERQYGGAAVDFAGVAEYGPWVYRVVSRLRETADVVIVSVHAGPEDSPWPTPDQQDLYQSFVDAGADIVHGHHPHMPQGWEAYAQGHIFYGLGNFSVPQERWSERFMGLVSLAVQIRQDATASRGFAVSHEFIEQNDDSSRSHRAATHGEQLREYSAAVRQPLADRTLLEALWQEVAVRQFWGHYLRYTQIANVAAPQKARRLLSLIRQVGDSLRLESGVELGRLDFLHHATSCPTHSQAVEAAAGVLSGMVEDRRSAVTREMVDRWAPAVPHGSQLPEDWTR